MLKNLKLKFCFALSFKFIILVFHNQLTQLELVTNNRRKWQKHCYAIERTALLRFLVWAHNDASFVRLRIERALRKLTPSTSDSPFQLISGQMDDIIYGRLSASIYIFGQRIVQNLLRFRSIFQAKISKLLDNYMINVRSFLFLFLFYSSQIHF